ncbi:MAG: AAA family ATPase [Gordonia sp. (in: high G+C Gram-positive bacteria)]|uniref:AAA family ATPase n=1 Tax=Gordonia sp. (in: high G+C Gram-positive bacteria) TaxID=84139 RepID=UPI0039E626DA
MRLHRLSVKDFRGIDDREICFAETGVTVVEGPNEAGKSSMMDAFHLLLRTRADSKSAEVKAIQPSGRDVGSEVTADVSCGPYRFTYFKRFNRRAATTLTVSEPVHEQLTGREAHDRVVAIMNDSLDDALFQALRVVQTEAPDLGTLTDSSALARALDRVAAPSRAGADDDADGDAEAQALIEAATSEYLRYYTLKTGRTAGELAEAEKALQSAQADVADLVEQMQSAEEATAALPEVEQEHRDTVGRVSLAEAAFAEAGTRVAEAEKATAQLAQAQERARGCGVTVELRERDLAERETAEKRVARLVEQATADEAVVRDQLDQAETADAECRKLEHALTEAQEDLTRIQRELAAAEAAEQAGRNRARIAAIDAALDEAHTLSRQREQVAAEVESNPVSAEHVAAARRLRDEMVQVQAQVDAIAATVEVTRTGAAEVVVDGDSITEPTVFTAVGETVVEAPGVRVVVRGPADAQALAARLEGLRAEESDLLARCGVESLDRIPVRADARSAGEQALKAIDDARRRILGDAAEDGLRAERDALAAALPDVADPEDLRSVAELRSAEREQTVVVARAGTELAERRGVADRCRARAEAGTVAAERARAAVKAGRAALSEQRSKNSDDALRGALVTAQNDLVRAIDIVVACRREAEGQDLPALRAACDEAEKNLDRNRVRLAELQERRTRLRTILEQCREEDRMDRLAAAEDAERAAQADLDRVRERAAGARLLYDTLCAKRTESRSRYVEPFTRRLEELAEPVFGESVRFEVSDDFTIARRILDGVAVDVKQLSGGAREQLGLIARLACAMIVDQNDGVPVILDDTLGYTDPERLSAMARVLGSAADDAQIIVLTCTPARFAGVPDATVVTV